MATIVTRAGKGSALTFAEGDANFTNLNTAKIELTDLSVQTGLEQVIGGGLSYNNTTGVFTFTPVSVDVASSLGYTPENTANKNANNGYAGLDAGGKVASAQLPSYVDDVLEFANLAAFPATGETGKIFVALDTGKIYRWSGSAYIEISPSPGSTDAVTEGSTNLYFTTARARDAFSASTGITLTNGAIATTITQYTDTDARASVSVTDAGGDGSLAYNSSTGVITYTGPSASEVRAHISAGTGIGYDSATGVISSTITQGITSVSADTSPQLGGNLDVSTRTITTTVTNGNVDLVPNGTGRVRVTGGPLQAQEIRMFTGVFVSDLPVFQSLQAYANSAVRSVKFAKARGTTASPTAVQEGDNIFNLQVAARNTTNEAFVWNINTQAGEPVSGFTPSYTALTVKASASENKIVAEWDSEGMFRVNALAPVYNNDELFITSNGNGDITIIPGFGEGTGKTVVGNIVTIEKQHSLGTASGTITPDAANGNVQTITLNGNLTLNAFTTPVAGQTIKLIVRTGGTDRTLTSSMKFAGGEKTLSVTDTIDIISVYYDGTDYLATLTKGFA